MCSLPSRGRLCDHRLPLTMRIVIATGIFPPDVGGPATHTSQLAEELRVRGHDVRVLSLTDERAPVIEPGLVRFPRRWPWPVRTIAVIGWLLRRRRTYDVLYANGLDVPAVISARLGRRPVVLKVVGDHAWERGRRLGLTQAGFDDFQAERPRSARLRGMRAARTWTARAATAVVTPSEYLRATVEGWTGGKRRVEVVPNGARRSVAAVPPAVPAASPPAAPADLHLVYLGRLVEHKRVDVLVDAVDATEGVTLAIVGDGPERAALERRAGNRVRFCGPLPHDDAMHQLAGSHALVNASAYEGLPHIAVEALVHGVPVLCSASGGSAEVVEDGRNGLLVDRSEPAAFAAAFARVRDDRALLATLATGARETGESWTFQGCADRVERLLDDAVRGRPIAVFVGRAIPFPPTPELRRKFTLHARLLRQTSVTTGGRGIVWVGGVRVVFLPQLRRGVVGGAVFYATAPFVALGLAAARRRAALVCQSPFEAFGVVLLSRLLPRPIRPRIQVELHGDWRSASRLYGSPARALLGPASDRLAEWALRRADRVRAVSQSLAGEAREAGYAGPIDQHFTFSDFSAFVAARPEPFPTTPVALFVGVLERYKAVDVLLAAWEDVVDEIPEARLVVVGDGTLGAELRRRAHARPMHNVDLRSPLRPPELASLYDACTCLVLPSRSEGLPRVVMEAMARGRPVVASDVGGMRELVEEGVTGRVVPPEDVGALAKALRDVLADPEGAERMGRVAHSRAEERNPAAEYEEGIRRLASWIHSG